MKNRFLIWVLTLILAHPAGGSTADNGTFRFLTQSLPEGTTNGEYIGRFITANADGPVVFTALSALPDGLSLDPVSGFLTGIPTQTFNNTISVVADDGVQQIQFDVSLKINAAGGGGNSGASFANDSVDVGRVGVIYTNQLSIVDGVGPFTFGAKDLPPGISLNGQTGTLTGNPSAAGRYFVTFSAYDAGEGNYSATVLPLLVLPSNSDFRFLTQSLNNGQAGTPYYEACMVTNANGNVNFAATGLPLGLTLDRTTGVISGTPTNAGSFEVLITATDDENTITSNLAIIIVPSASSNFYWNVFSLPPGLLDVAYNRQPPIAVAAVNGNNVNYAASGLPPGISYNTTSGELTGTPTTVGEFDTLFTATNGAAEVISLQFHFIILPTTGGDLSSVPLNLWLTKQKVTLGVDGQETWKGILQFNADRRTGQRFDPVADNLSLSLGSRTINVPSNSLAGTVVSMSAATPAGQSPAESVKLSMSKQMLQWGSSRDSLAMTVPGLHNFAFSLGDQSYRTTVRFDAKGGANALSAVRPCFVLAKGTLRVGNSGADSAALALLLSDTGFVYETGDALRVRLLHEATVVADRDFTVLGVGTQTTDNLGKLVFSVKTLPDNATTNRISKFNYKSAKGKMALALSGLTLGAVANGETHLTIELTIRDRIYSTGVTFFGTNPGTYSTAMPLP